MVWSYPERCSLVMWRKRMQPLVFLDNETTGHDPLMHLGSLTDTEVKLIPWHEIIEIGAIVANPKTFKILDTFEIKIAPRHPERCLSNLINHYPERAAKGEWDNAIPLYDAVQEFIAFCGKWELVHLIGQNFFFDWGFWKVALTVCGITSEDIKKIIHYKMIDVASMAVQELLTSGECYDPQNFSLRSGLLQRQLSLPPEPEPHTALDGAFQAYSVFLELRKLRSNR